MPLTLISRTTLTTTAASVTFSSIPQTYQTLKLVVSARTNYASALDYIWMRFNTDSGNNYTRRTILGDGTNVASSNATQSGIATSGTGANATSNTFGSFEQVIPNYSLAANKAISSDETNENNATLGHLILQAGLWSNTSAVSSVLFVPVNGTAFVSGSTFSLYGVS